MSGEQSSEINISEKENEYTKDGDKVKVIVCFVTIVIFLTNNQLNVYSRHFSAVFRISQVNSQIYISKLYTFRTLLIILGSLVKFFIFKIPAYHSTISLISLFLIVVCRLVLVILLHFTKTLFIHVFYLLLYEAFLFGIFYCTFLKHVFKLSLYIILSTDLSITFAFFLQSILTIFLDNNPLLIIKIQSWTSLLLSIIGFILWYHFIKVIYTPGYEKSEKIAGEINKILGAIGALSHLINEFSTEINDEIEKVRQVFDIKQKATSFLNELKNFVTELPETKHNSNKNEQILENKSNTDLKTSNYLINAERKLDLLDKLVSKIEKIISLGKTRTNQLFSHGDNLYARLNSENTLLKDLRLKKSFLDEVNTFSGAIKDHFNGLDNGAKVVLEICKVNEELNIVETVKNLQNIQNELDILLEQISSLKTNLDSVGEYSDLIKKAIPSLTKILHILSSTLKSVMNEDASEIVFLEQSYNNVKKRIVETGKRLKEMFDDYLSKIKPISTKDALKILLSLDLLYDLKILSVIKCIDNFNDLILQIQDIREELISLLENIQKFKFNLPPNSQFLFEQWTKDPKSSHLLLDLDPKYYQIKDFYQFYSSLKNTNVSELLVKFQEIVEKWKESLQECFTQISTKQIAVKKFKDNYNSTKEALEGINLDKNIGKITLHEHKNKLSSLIKDIIKIVEGKNEDVEGVLEDLVHESSKEVFILLKKINLLVTKKSETRIKNLQNLPLLEFPNITITVYKENWNFLVLTPFFSLISMFAVTSFFFEFLFPRFIPYALLEPDVSARVNLLLNPFKVSGSMVLFHKIYFKKNPTDLISLYNLYWLLIIPQFLIFLWSLLSVHTSIPIFTFIRNSSYWVLTMGLVLVICNSIMEGVSFLVLAGKLVTLDESSILLEIHFVLSVFLRYLYSRLSIGYNNARISMGLIPRRFIPNIIVINPLRYWIIETLWRSYRNVITDLTTNLVDVADNP